MGSAGSCGGTGHHWWNEERGCREGLFRTVELLTAGHQLGTSVSFLDPGPRGVLDPACQWFRFRLAQFDHQVDTNIIAFLECRQMSWFSS